MMTTTSSRALIRSLFALIASRYRLLARFLCGLFPIFFEVANPIRPFPGRNAALASSPAERPPSLNTASNRFLLGPRFMAIPLVGDARAAFQAATLDNVLTVGGAHSHTEPVGLALLAVVGLVSPLHESSGPLKR